MSDIVWIQTTAGLQMAETITRQLPKLVEKLHQINSSLEDMNSNLIDIEGRLIKGVEELEDLNKR